MSRDLKYQLIYRSKKNTYGIPNTYRCQYRFLHGRNTYPILLYRSPSQHCVPSTVLYSAVTWQFHWNTYRTKINIPKYPTEQNQNTGLLPSIKKYWKVTKIPTYRCPYQILPWAALSFQSLVLISINDPQKLTNSWCIKLMFSMWKGMTFPKWRWLKTQNWKTLV